MTIAKNIDTRIVQWICQFHDYNRYSNSIYYHALTSVMYYSTVTPFKWGTILVIIGDDGSEHVVVYQ